MSLDKIDKKNKINKILSKYTKSGTPIKDLSRFTLLCEKLGNPQNDLKYIHIAGTNGKGSVSEYITQSLIENSYSVGKFTSPFIINVNERIEINGNAISDEDFLRILIAADEVINEEISGCSQFELINAAAFLYFREMKVDFVVLETGLGGLLDSTNIVMPVLSIITQIGIDHQSILGETIEEIAFHKAGIIKSNVPVICYPDVLENAFDIINKTAREKSSEIIKASLNDIKINKTSILGNSFIYKNTEFQTKMGGVHQVYNAVTAIDALIYLKIKPDIIKSALAKASIRGRAEVISKEPLVIVDGAHNESGINALKAVVEPLISPKVAVIGAYKGKNVKEMIENIMTFADYIIFTDKFSENAVKASELKSFVKGFSEEKMFIENDPINAVLLAKKLVDNPVILITGSLYLAGYYLSENLFS